MSIRSMLTEPSKPLPPVAFWSYVTILLFGLTLHILMFPRQQPGWPHDRNLDVVTDGALLLLFLAHGIRWPQLVTAPLRILAWSWSVFAVLYLLFVGIMMVTQ